MGISKVFISFAMLVVLGAALASEAFGRDTHIPSCSSDGVLSSAFGSCDHGSVTSASATENHQSQHCQDPCHLGMSHFGHCSVVLQSISIGFATMGDSNLLGHNVQNRVKAPDLDGPRRPPRLA